jgi:hypothetical protein
MRAAGQYARGTALRVVAVTVLVAVALLAHAGVSSAQTATSAPAGVVVAATGGSSAAVSSPATAKAGDNASTRTVNRIIGVLVFFGIALLALAGWFWWATKPVPRHLDALDAMSSRAWRQAGAAERSAMLGPVHERRAEAREEDLIAPSPVEPELGESGPAPAAEVVVSSAATSGALEAPEIGPAQVGPKEMGSVADVDSAEVAPAVDVEPAGVEPTVDVEPASVEPVAVEPLVAEPAEVPVGVEPVVAEPAEVPLGVEPAEVAPSAALAGPLTAAPASAEDAPPEPAPRP